MGSVKARVEFPYKQRSQKSLIKEKSWEHLLYHRAVPANNLTQYLEVIVKQMYLLWYLK